MQQKISEEEIEFLEAFYDPTAMMECLIPKNIRASHLWGQEDCEGIDVRPYQQVMLNYSYMYADDDRLDEKQNFRQRKGAGDSTNIGARNIGKSFIEICDQFFTLIHYDGDESCVASFDYAHLKKIGQPMVDLTKYHPFFTIVRKPKVDCARFTGGGFEMDTINGHMCYGKNEKVEGSEPGTAFHGLHYKTFRYEEFSYASKEGAEKRVDSGNSIGYINRVSGIPDLRLGSPLGEILYDDDLKPWVCRLPQYVRCISEDSLILMSDFTQKKIQDINIGDKILTVTDKQKFGMVTATVLNKIYNGERDTVKISNNKNSLVLTSDHKFLCKSGKFYINWQSADTIKSKHEVYHIDTKIDNIKEYYIGAFLGFLETEGSFKKDCVGTIGQKCEKSALEFLLKQSNIEYSIWQDKKLENFSYYYLKQENKDRVKHHYALLETSDSCKLGFIAGAILGDGCIQLDRKEVVLVQKNKCEIIEKVLKELNLSYGKWKHSGTSLGCFTYRFSIMDIPIVIPYSKKTDKYMKIVNNLYSQSLKRDTINIEKHKKTKVWDLTTTSKTFVANSFVVHNCDWDEKEKDKRAKEYNGVESLSYKLNVEAELVEGAFGYFSMERLKENCYSPKKSVKFFEVGKKTFDNFKKNIIIDKIPCEQIIVASDIGTTGTPSEICIFFGDAEKFKWRYNIALQKLTTQEQAKVFHWLYKKLGGCIISLDATNADGRAIADELEILKVPKKHIVRCAFGSNMIIGFETEEDPDDPTKEIVLTDNKGEPIYKLENSLDWANMELEHVFYNGLVDIPHNDKFLKQFQGYFCVKTGNRSKYGSNTEDHLLQSFQCFALARFQNYGLIFQPEDEEQTTFLGGF